ncbi:hypothetical protein GCM10010449_15260 [Streptomyces rectiviolaceus]|uniref:Anti-sigma factor antagonist n=1 Tax=Streptomyces rectiviolaceus TaxID=332591 RepID=A0ABP6M9S2_9ACTN
MVSASPQPLHVDTVAGLGPVLMRVCGDLDMDTAPSLQTMLEPFLAQRVEMDLANVTFIDSSGVNVLLSHLEQCRAAGGVLVVLQPSRPVQQVLQLLGVHRLLMDRPRTEGGQDPGGDFPGPY